MTITESDEELGDAPHASIRVLRNGLFQLDQKTAIRGMRIADDVLS